MDNASLIVTIITAWWISICKEGTLYHFVWALFVIAFLVAWVTCIKSLYESYKDHRRLSAFGISILFDLLMLHTVIGLWGILLSSDEGAWNVSDIIVGNMPFWIYLMAVAYPAVFGGIFMKEKKIIKGTICIVASILVVVVGWMMIAAWARSEIGI